jgi:hypothetical protein
MGRTSTANKPLPLNNSPEQLSVSWESNTARVKASKNFNIYSKYSKYLYYIRINVPRSSGLVVTSDFFSGIALGSSLFHVGLP